jgi:hypothetical protein
MSTPDFFLPPELVAAALEELTRDCHTQIDRLAAQPKQGDPDVKDETKFWLSQYRSFTKAAYHWARGVRPAVSDAGAWLIPSASQPGAVVHEVTRHGGVWVCGPTCEAGKRGVFHWHSALIQGIERARELADLHDDGPDCDEADADAEPFLPPTAEEVAAWRARLATEARRQMDELFAA